MSVLQEFTKYLLQHTESCVVGLSRDVHNAPGLQQLAEQYSPRLQLVSMDLEDQDSIDRAVQQIRAAAPSPTPSLDLLVNCSAVLGGGPGTRGPERNVDSIDRDWLCKSFEVTFLPCCVTLLLALHCEELRWDHVV